MFLNNKRKKSGRPCQFCDIIKMYLPPFPLCAIRAFSHATLKNMGRPGDEAILGINFALPPLLTYTLLWLSKLSLLYYAEIMLSLSQPCPDGDRIISLSLLVKECTALCTHIMIPVLISSELVSLMTFFADLLRTQWQTSIYKRNHLLHYDWMLDVMQASSACDSLFLYDRMFVNLGLLALSLA